MSSNIYEDPDWMMDVRYSKGARGRGEDRGERKERLVDIYDSCDGSTQHHVVSLQRGGAHTQTHLPAAQRNPFRDAALILGLLCLLLLVGVTFLSTLFILQSNQLNNEMKKTGTVEVKDDCLQEKDHKTQGNITRWVRFECSCYYVSAEMKIWSESRRDCQSREADLVIINSKNEQEYVSSLNNSGNSWIGLRTKAWQTEWQWVDETKPTYQPWREGVTLTPVGEAFVYIDLQGYWNHIKNGSKHWICEKRLTGCSN